MNTAKPAASQIYSLPRSWLQDGVISKVTFATVTDGLSNTVAVAECLIGERDLSPATGGSYRRRLATGTGGHYTTAPQTFLNTKGPGGNYAATQALHAGHVIGSAAFYPYVHQSWVHTLLPPNSPNCHNDWHKALITASSNHSGGVNVGFLDGSVHFVSDTINTVNLNRASTSLSSPTDSAVAFTHGVLGCLGAINDGVAVTLP
jgi:prepilin-type processing-associated H-X9-DG protein